MHDLQPEAIEAILEKVGAESETSVLTVEVRHLGGALCRPLPDAGALATLDAAFLLFGGCLVDSSEAHARAEADLSALVDSVAEWDAGRRYANFNESAMNDVASDLFPRDTYERLKSVKAAVDPNNLFLAAHPIQPA